MVELWKQFGCSGWFGCLWVFSWCLFFLVLLVTCQHFRFFILSSPVQCLIVINELLLSLLMKKYILYFLYTGMIVRWGQAYTS